MLSLIGYIWFGAWIASLITASYFKSKMLNHARVPGATIPYASIWSRGFTYLADPECFTEQGQVYRSWTVRAEFAGVLLFVTGMLVVMPVLAHFAYHNDYK
jgi:hypothetical protein